MPCFFRFWTARSNSAEVVSPKSLMAMKPVEGVSMKAKVTLLEGISARVRLKRSRSGTPMRWMATSTTVPFSPRSFSTAWVLVHPSVTFPSISRM